MVKLTVRGSSSAARDFGRRLARNSHDITCPNCKRSIAVKLGDMRPGGFTKCASCGVRINFEGDDVVGETEKAIEKFTKDLKRIFK